MFNGPACSKGVSKKPLVILSAAKNPFRSAPRFPGPELRLDSSPVACGSVTSLALRMTGMVALGFLLAGVARAQDLEKGKQVFVQCGICHAPDKRNGTGPGLGGIVGRKAGTAAGFRYSRAMKTANLVWEESTLDAYLTEPQKVVPGSVMPFSGVPDATARADLMAYLKTLK